MFTREDLIYLAGMVDADGCITLTGGRRPSPRLMVANTDHGLLDWLEATFGGYVNAWKARFEHRKPISQWRLDGEKATDLLAQFYPFLKIKREQALLAMSYQLAYTPLAAGHARKLGLSSEEKALRASYVKRMRALNKVGR